MSKGSSGLRRGFTLIEMVMVLVIIGLLASIVVPQFSGQMDDAREAQTRANLENLRSAIAIYAKRYGNFPTSLDQLSSASPAILAAVPNDAWNNPYIYMPGDGTVHCNPSGPNSTKCQATW